MAHFEYSKFDGSEQFKPQSADAVFDELTRHMLDWGDDVLDYLDQWEDQHPDVVDMLIKRGYVEKDSEGKYYVTPKGIRRVESKALEELFQIARKDKLGKHETEFRGAGQTVHEESKPYEFGDPVSNLNMHETLKNASSAKAAARRCTSPRTILSSTTPSTRPRARRSSSWTCRAA
jgi:uncharacterized protein with von Willebrand factor type A (vWA) domain